MRPLELLGALLVTLCAAACEPAVPGAATPEPAAVAVTIDSGFTTVAESAWVAVDGPTLVGFYPVVSNERLEADEGLSTALDDFSYHIGTAMDSLMAAGFTVQYRGGDTVWLRARNKRTRVVRATDSATVGYVFADALGRRAVIYGVRGYTDLVEYAHEFKRTGTLRPR